MTPIQLNFYLFLAAVIAFAWVGFSASRRQHSVNDYFHHANLSQNVVSLTASNLTLGTGLVYLVSGAQQNGLLMLLPVACVGIGYWLLAAFLKRLPDTSLRTGKNFLAAVDSEISRATGRKSWFAPAVSAPLVILFVLLLAFEIFTSSKVISPFLFQQPSQSSEIMLSLAIFSITVLYAVLGGVRAVFDVDFLQVPLLCLFIPAFVWLGIPDLDNPAALVSRLGESFKTDSPIVVAILIACINSIATQFYSLLNWGSVSHVEAAKQARMMKWVGLATTVVLVLFVLVGLLHPRGESGQVWQDLVQHFSTFATQSTPAAFLISGTILLGMTSILLTTTDAVVINCVMFWYDNLTGGDSKDERQNKKALRTVRWIGATAFGMCFGVLLFLNYSQPDPFFLLLTMTGGVVVFAPMIVTAGFLAARGDSLAVFTPIVTFIYVGLFLIAGIVDVFLLSRQPELIPYVGLTAFVLAGALSLVLITASPTARSRSMSR